MTAYEKALQYLIDDAMNNQIYDEAGWEMVDRSAMVEEYKTYDAASLMRTYKDIREFNHTFAKGEWKYR